MLIYEQAQVVFMRAKRGKFFPYQWVIKSWETNNTLDTHIHKVMVRRKYFRHSWCARIDIILQKYAICGFPYMYIYKCYDALIRCYTFMYTYMMHNININARSVIIINIYTNNFTCTGTTRRRRLV